MTKEQVYKAQMQALGIYEEIFDPEIRTLARIERELTRAMKAWSETAVPPGSRPSFLDPHYAVIQKLRSEILQHRESLGLTPKALRKLTGAAGADTPEQKDLISRKLDQIADRVAGYDAAARILRTAEADPYAGIPGAEEAAEISDLIDEELRRAVHEDMG